MSYLHDLIFYQPITPLHVGCGQDVGVVDLPVIRERTTAYPFIPGSGIRGSLRQAFSQRGLAGIARLFGPTAEESENGQRYAGCLAVHDAKILLFPVRSDRAPFLWITCPAVLERFSRDVRFFLAEPGEWPIEVPAQEAEDETVRGFPGSGSVSLEEMDFQATELPPALRAWLETLGVPLELVRLSERAVLVSDNVFHYFVTHATQVLQHNRLTAAKTVAQGQLFSVEAVPPESVFYGFLGVTRPRHPQETQEEDLEAPEVGGPETREEAQVSLRGLIGTGHSSTWLQLGGDEGTGLGVTRLVWAQFAGGGGEDAP